MSSCGCGKQRGGGSKKCSCKKCRRYSQRGGEGFFGSLFGTSDEKTPQSTTKPLDEKNCISKDVYDELQRKYDDLLAKSTQSDKLPSEETQLLPQSQGISRGGGGGNMMSRMEMVRGGDGELGTIRQDANIGLYSGPSINTLGIATQQGGKRKIRKTRRMKKSRKHTKSRKYRR